MIEVCLGISVVPLCRSAEEREVCSLHPGHPLTCHDVPSCGKKQETPEEGFDFVVEQLKVAGGNNQFMNELASEVEMHKALVFLKNKEIDDVCRSSLWSMRCTVFQAIFSPMGGGEVLSVVSPCLTIERVAVVG
mgnify:FL=1